MTAMMETSTENMAVPLITKSKYCMYCVRDF